MPDPRLKRCKSCGRHASEVGELSWSRQCAECGDANLRENIYGLHTHTGPALARWRRGMAACIGGVLLDDLPPAA